MARLDLPLQRLFESLWVNEPPGWMLLADCKNLEGNGRKVLDYLQRLSDGTFS